jgi:hypothetical protein
MTASSSRVMKVERPTAGNIGDWLSDRALHWYDTGAGYRLRRWCRTQGQRVVTISCGRFQAVTAHLARQPQVQRLTGILAPPARTTVALVRSLVARLATLVPRPPEPSRPVEPSRAVSALPTATPAPRPVDPPSLRSTATHRTPATRPRLEPGTRPVTRPTMASVPVVEGSPRPTARDTTPLRCWSCLRRVSIVAPRRGGCYHCPSCSELMMAVDPLVGMTCSLVDADERGVSRSAGSSETEIDPGRALRRARNQRDDQAR